MAFHNIKLYPYESDEDDEHDRALNESIQDLIPFAVVGSEKTIVVDGKPVRGRQNRWGVINGMITQAWTWTFMFCCLDRDADQMLLDPSSNI